MSLFCRHEWKIVSQEITESPLEMTLRASKEAGIILKDARGGLVSTKRLHITTVQCKKCSKVHIKKIILV